MAQCTGSLPVILGSISISVCLLKVLSPPKAIFMLEAHERLGGAGAVHIYRIVPLHHFLITGILCQYQSERDTFNINLRVL